MVIRLGNNPEPSALYHGSDPVSRVYLGSTQVWPMAANASISVTVSRSTLGVAPERLTFRVTDWTDFETAAPAGPDGYDARLHNIVYYADFGDQDTKYNAPVNGLPEWRNRNQGFGSLLAHVYRKPGTYTVTIWAYELNSDKIAVWTQDVTIGDPDTAFSAAQTAYVSVDSEFSNAPAGVAQFTSLSVALADRLNDERTRIILRAGETHVGLDNINLNQTNAPGDTHLHIVTDYDRVDDDDLDAPTTELQSVTNQVWNRIITFRGFTHSSDIVIQGIQFKGPWDSTTETGSTQYDGLNFFASSTQPRHILVDDCGLDGFHQCISYANGAGAVPSNSGFTLHDSTVTNWSNFGAYISGAAHVEILGSAMVQHVDARSGGDQGDKNTNDHGPIRFNCNEKNFTLIDGSDFFSRTGWVENTAGEIRTQQPCIRGNQDAAAGSWFNLNRSGLEGGWEMIKMTATNGLVTDSQQNVICDMILAIGSHHTSKILTCASGGVTFRNSFCIIPNVPRADGVFDPAGVVVLAAPNDLDAVNGEVQIYNNTIVNSMQDSNAGSGIPVFSVSFIETGASGLHSVTEANNILHQPNLSTPDTVNGPLSLGQIYTPREKGYKPSTGQVNAGVLDTTYATPSDTVQIGPFTSRVPVSGTPASMFDLYGRERPSNPAIGAIEG